MQRLMLFAAVLLLGAGFLGAQSNDRIDEILANPRVTAGQALYVVLVAAERVPAEADEATAIEAARQLGLEIPADVAAAVSMGQFAFWVARAFDIPGGVMYSLFPGPRYALRELSARRIVPGRPDGGRPISGEEALRIIGNALAWKEQS